MVRMIGIDLGTTNSLATYIDDNGKIEFVKNEYGNILIPSVVGIDENDDIIVGELAKERRMMNAGETASNFKRRMGTDAKIKVKNRTFDAQMLSSFVLKHLKENAEKQLNEKINRAIISVPAYFNDKQRRDTKMAAELAGLTVERLINEPTAAALSLGSHILDQNLKFIVLDLGGGTFDVTLLETFENIMEVLSISGDTMLGGEDFTTKICEIFLKNIKLSIVDLSRDERTKLYTKADRAKKLISLKNVEIEMEIKGKKYKSEITQENFRETVKPLLVKMKVAIDKALQDGNTDAREIEKVILVGGAVKLGIIEEFVEKYFHKMRGEKIYFNNDDFIENNKLVSIAADPDTVVAYGVGIAVGMKERNKVFKERILTDVCPFTLGTEIVGRRFAPIIPRNTTVPTSRSEYFYTIEDYQSQVTVGIYQGESLNIDDNLFLGEFLLDVPQNLAGKEAINVRFTYDINGILEVEAKVVSTGLKKSKLIVNGDLSEEEKNEKIKMLEEIKIQSENKNKDKLLLERVNRIYAEIVNTEIRNHISDYLENYKMVVATGDRIRIQKAKESFSQFLDKIDPEINDMNIEDILKDFEDEMEEEDMKEEDELGFWN
ncbi:Hsp70 family protein [Leptotrichia sp. oral taxon 417]|uniref:Hsp70 family protein n=1 Tax=Leptotrichia sp. oral taxon 417 TaxID=712365 RepID=UPI0015BC2914|nr:Hsp70 family protein [Leptotrichia sp. oral taxon 417]NWO27410.1 Hsp70 family protein [Leptotrichia sp. oral taxon 417]